MRANEEEIVYIKEDDDARIMKNNTGVLWTGCESYIGEKRCKLFEPRFRSYAKAIKGSFKLPHMAANFEFLRAFDINFLIQYSIEERVGDVC